MAMSRNLRVFQRTFERAFRTYHAPYRLPAVDSIRASSAHSLSQRDPSQRRITPQTRAQSTETSPKEPEVEQTGCKPLTDREDSSISDAEAIAARKALSPAYQLWFTCKKCLARSGHTVSKQAYHFGTCVINCPTCKSQHLISDHLKIFSDTKMTMEDIAKEHGEKLRKGRLGVDGDVEFYDDQADLSVEENDRMLDSHQERVEARKAMRQRH